MQVQVMTTYEKHLYGVTDAPLIRATHVLKTHTWVEYMYSTIHKKQEPLS